MKKHFLVYVSMFIGICNIAQAQSTFKFPENYPNAYTEYIYDAKDVKVVTETYEKNVPKISFPPNVNNVKDNVVLDIYYGENSAVNIGLKPLIIFSPGGGREKSDYKFIASDLARRGFVTASINVRGSTVNNLQLMFNAKNINPVLVSTGAMDLHNAIKYIINQRAKALSVDPNYVIVAGGSLGGAISLQGAFMDKEEANAKFGKNLNNDFFKDLDPELQKNNIKGVLDFYGAVYDVNFIKPTETKPVFIFHGTTDPAVPYMEGNLFYNPLDVYVYGGVRIAEKIKDNNSYYFISGKDVGHTLTPQCNYNVNSFPNGYPMGWYPDMLYFVKNAILGNQTIKVTKTIECVEPECSINKNSCRVVADDANNASRKASNAVIPSPTFNKNTAQLPNVLKSATNNGSAPISSISTVVNNTNPKLDHCKAFSFDGNDFIKINNSPSLAVGFDVEFWFKQTTSNPENNLEILFSMGTSNNIRGSAFTFGLLGNDKVYLGYFSGNSYVEKTVEILNNQNKPYSVDNEWHHYHFKVSDGNLTGEIDGNKGTFNLPNSIRTAINTDNTSNTYLGGADFNTGSISYKYNNAIGLIHEIRLWKIGYSYDYHDEAVAANTTGLVACWKLNANTQVVKDDGPYKIDGVFGSNNSIEKKDPLFVNDCNGTTTSTTPNTSTTNTPKQDTTTPVVSSTTTIEREGISIVNTTKKPIISFFAPKSGKAVVRILSSANKLLTIRTVVFSVGENMLSTYIQALKPGNYTIKVTLNAKSYTQKFTIPK